MSILEKVIPLGASNDYRGSRIALYFFPVVLTVFTARSFIHFLKNDSGVNSIASIHLFPVGEIDPNNVIYLFSSLWGTQQLITIAIAWIVLWRYRNLIPLMYAFLFIEIVLRIAAGAIHPLTPDYYARRPPGGVMNLPALFVFATMFVLSLRTARQPEAASELARPATS